MTVIVESTACLGFKLISVWIAVLRLCPDLPLDLPSNLTSAGAPMRRSHCKQCSSLLPCWYVPSCWLFLLLFFFFIRFESQAQIKASPTIPAGLEDALQAAREVSCCPWVTVYDIPPLLLSVWISLFPLCLTKLLSLPSCCSGVFAAPASVRRRHWAWPLQQHPVLYDSNPFDSKRETEC